MKALVGAFNQEKALVGAFSMIVQPVVEPMEHYTALVYDLAVRKRIPLKKRRPCKNVKIEYNSTNNIHARSIELRDTGSYGFLLPPSEIIPNAEEAWAFHVVAAQQVIQEFSP